MARQSDPGWYPDPGGQPATQRWWDGGSWSHVTRPAPEGAPSVPATTGWTSTKSDRSGPGRFGQPGQSGPGQFGQPGQSGPGRSARAASTPDGVPLAALGIRFLARIVDHLLISMLSAAIGYPFLSQLVEATRAWWSDALLAIDRGAQVPRLDLLSDATLSRAFGGFLVVSVLVSATYTVGLLRLRGATVGKLMTRIRVRSWQSEGRLSWGQAAARWLTGEGLTFAVSVYLLLDYLWPIWDPRRQALHDKLAGTVVVRVAGRAPAS